MLFDYVVFCLMGLLRIGLSFVFRFDCLFVGFSVGVAVVACLRFCCLVGCDLCGCGTLLVCWMTALFYL